MLKNDKGCKISRPRSSSDFRGGGIHDQGPPSPDLLARQMIAGHLPNTAGHRNFCSLDVFFKYYQLKNLTHKQ